MAILVNIVERVLLVDLLFFVLFSSHSTIAAVGFRCLLRSKSHFSFCWMLICLDFAFILFSVASQLFLWLFFLVTGGI